MQLMIIERFSNIPLVKTSIEKATDVYVKVKKSNRIIEWSLQTAEATVTIAVDLGTSTIPVVLLDGPIHLIDEILCKSLEMVEDAVPIIKQQPDEIYLEAKKVVTSVMEPVLKRADSVKEISIKLSNKAAQSIDDVLTAADGIVDKYLPEMDDVDKKDGSLVPVPNPSQNSVEKTIRHLSYTSRTLGRRLTQRTLYEAHALKVEGKNIIHELLSMTNMLARDPKQFAQRMRELWNHLSEDEPENQKPPQNLEELIVMLTREGARRFVHVANFITSNTVKIPQYAHKYISAALSEYSDYISSLNLNSSGIKRKAEILINSIHDIFDNFFKMIKPILPAFLTNENKQAIEAGSSTSEESQANEEGSEKSNASETNGKGSENSNQSKTSEEESNNSNESQANGTAVQT